MVLLCAFFLLCLVYFAQSARNAGIDCPPVLHSGSLPPSARDISDMFEAEGLLVMMTPLSAWVTSYSPTGPCHLQSDVLSFRDATDLQAVLNISKRTAATSCYAIATTLIHNTLPVLVFGPTDFPGDFPIGLILDVRHLSDYIACMAPVDSGSIVRYDEPESIAHAAEITPMDMRQRYGDLLEDCKSSGACGLSAAGCGKSGGVGGVKGIGYSFHEPNDTFFPPARCFPYNWTCSSEPNSMRLYSREAWQEFKETAVETSRRLTRQKRGIARKAPSRDSDIPALSESACGDYWDYQWEDPSGNGYHENEVNLFIPSRSSEDSRSCAPHPDVQEAWRKSVVGVFTNSMCAREMRIRNLEYSTEICCTSAFCKRVAKGVARACSTPVRAFAVVTERPDGPFTMWDPVLRTGKLLIEELQQSSD